MPFFSESTLLQTKRVRSSVPKCSLCKLYKTCNSPKMPVSGRGKKKILIVAEAPGKNEDEQGIQLVGVTGSFLEERLDDLGINMRRDCWLTNSVICRPENNRTPTDDELEWCRPNLTKTIEELKPVVILTIGKAALHSLLLDMWQGQKTGPMARWAGWKIPCRDLNTWICPTYHPSYVMREEREAKSGTAIRSVWIRHLEQAIRIKKRPYKKKPKDLREKIELLYDEKEIVKRLKKCTLSDKPIAFDFETNMLKPDHADADIVCASVCWNGKETIAFPWQGEDVVHAFYWLMKSSCPKIGFNCKFEDRWSHVKIEPEFQQSLGEMFPTEGVSEWHWDGMNMAHLIDNRPDICSLEFQNFVMLGISPYSFHISRFLEAKGSYTLNSIKKVDLRDLLLYCGLDSLSTYMLANKQRKILGMPKL